MPGYRLGLAASIIIGLLVAAFPLYSAPLSGMVWSYSASETGGGHGETSEIVGVVEAVYPEESTIVVEGVTLRVTGTWIGPGGEELEAGELLAILQPGVEVRAVYSVRGRWGAFLEEVTILSTGETYRRESLEWGG